MCVFEPPTPAYHKVAYWSISAWYSGVRMFVAFSLPFWAVGIMFLGSRDQHSLGCKHVLWVGGVVKF